MQKTEFNLLDEPWILTTGLGGDAKTLSLVDVFARAHELKALSGEIATQDAAVLRLLLAVLYAVHTRVDENGAPLRPGYEPIALWKRIWDKGRFDMGIIGGYLEKYHGRFWLFHPERPFWQVVFGADQPPVNRDGITLRPTAINVSKFIGDIADGDKPNMFCGRGNKNSIPFSEAARWLVHLNAFDVSPAGNPGKNPKTVKGFGHPWPANIGMTWASGGSLFQTLMLNLVLAHNGDCWPEGNAWWEAAPPCTTAEGLERVEVAVPESIVELMSMQFRYVALRREGGSVTGFDLWSGVKFDAENAFIEQMTSWKVAKKKDNARFPKKHDPAKQLWRDFAALVPHGAYDESPGVVKWLAALEYSQVPLPLLQLNTAGVIYKKDTAVADVFSDSLRMSAGILAGLDRDGADGDSWSSRIIKELETTEKMVECVGYLASNIEAASGGEARRDASRGEAKAEAYFRLDAPFRGWLAAIDPQNDDIDDTCARWSQMSYRMIMRLGEELAARAGEHALVGRVVKIGKNDALMASPKAFAIFKNSVNKALKNAG